VTHEGRAQKAVDRQSSRLHQAFARFDEANAEDPNQVLVDGVSQPKELVYAQRMTERLGNFYPDAEEALCLAVRSQHIRRWTIPRSRYPAGRAGYRKWRTTLAAFHADTASAILRDVGYEDSCVKRVQNLLKKERLKQDPAVQTLEDVACLVFIEHYLEAFAREHEQQKIVDILRKTWHKMSLSGREAALQIQLPQSLRSLIESAVT